jgi:hypothetical protein
MVERNDRVQDGNLPLGLVLVQQYRKHIHDDGDDCLLGDATILIESNTRLWLSLYISASP